jgi:FkbM family methyltransferase
MSQVLPSITRGQFLPAQMHGLLGRPDPIILEIGANNGMHTRHFMRVFPQAKIFAFEPDPRAIAKFKKRISDPRVVLFEGAIGAEDGEAEFHVSSGLPPTFTPEQRQNFADGWDLSGSLRAPKTHTKIWPWCKFEKTIRVPVRTLDSWTCENGIERIDFIWADTQGAEGDLVAGGRNTLARTRFFYTEYSNNEWYEGQPNLATLAAMLPGFDIVTRYSMDVLFKNKTL